MVVRTTVITLAGLVFLFSSPARAGDKGERPSILSARVFVADGVVVSDVTSRGLFSERVVRTVESGLPATVELLYILVSGDNRMVSRGLHVYELRCDVWEGLYWVAGLDSTRRFTSFTEMAGVIERLRRVPVIPIENVQMNGDYAVRFSIAVHPLRSGEDQEIVGWVGENVRGGTEQNWREQLLNLNDLIQHFFARGKDSATRSEWFETDSFVPRLLPLDKEGTVAPVDGSMETGATKSAAQRSDSDRDSKER